MVSGYFACEHDGENISFKANFEWDTSPVTWTSNGFKSYEDVIRFFKKYDEQGLIEAFCEYLSVNFLKIINEDDWFFFSLLEDEGEVDESEWPHKDKLKKLWADFIFSGEAGRMTGHEIDIETPFYDKTRQLAEAVQISLFRLWED